MPEAAPFHNNVAEGPEDVRAYWLQAADGVRLRAALWPNGDKGTIIVLNGRTECVEKYGRTARDFGAEGFAMASIDWRGQGLSDRLTKDRQLGYVGTMADYQLDVAALLDLVKAEALPQPYFLIGHSLGGGVGLRALMQGLPVRAAFFSAPMWGILFSPIMRPVAWVVSGLARATGLGALYAPSTSSETYILRNTFAENDLTHDADNYAYMQNQVQQYPALGLGGPSLRWLNEALLETRDMTRQSPPDVPALIGLGADESIVNPQAIRSYAQKWPKGKLLELPGAKHELLMETPAIREDLIAHISAFFQSKV